MDPLTIILLIVLLVILFGGGLSWYGPGRTAAGYSPLVLIVVVCLILYLLFGRGHSL